MRCVRQRRSSFSVTDMSAIPSGLPVHDDDIVFRASALKYNEHTQTESYYRQQAGYPRRDDRSGAFSRLRSRRSERAATNQTQHIEEHACDPRTYLPVPVNDPPPLPLPLPFIKQGNGSLGCPIQHFTACSSPNLPSA